MNPSKKKVTFSTSLGSVKHSSNVSASFTTKKGKRPEVNKIKILEENPTLQLSVRFRELLDPLLFPIRRNSCDDFDDADDDGFPGRKGWVICYVVA